MAALAVRGLEPELALDLAKRLDISQDRLSELAQIAKTTLHRRIKEHQPLAQDESERVIRLYTVYQKAVEYSRMKSVLPDGSHLVQKHWEAKRLSSL